MTRKPRVGELLVDGLGRHWEVVRFDSTQPDLVHIRQGVFESAFIWRFATGLNRWLSELDTRPRDAARYAVRSHPDKARAPFVELLDIATPLCPHTHDTPDYTDWCDAVADALTDLLE